MTTPSPFELGRAIGGNVSGGIRGARENSELEDILSQVRNQESPENLESILQRLSPERQQVARGAMQRQGQQRAYQAQGLDPSIASLDPAIQKEIFKQKGQSKGVDSSGTLSAIDELEKLSGQTGIGFSGRINPSEDARFNRGRFQSLQAKLLPLFKGMFPRGMTEKEFKFIQANYIPQVGDTEAKIKGKLQGLRELAQESSGSPMQQKSQAVEMKDSQGNVYDIPADLVEKARSQGLQ